MVPPARLELASPKATDFKSAVFTNFTKGADSFQEHGLTAQI